MSDRAKESFLSVVRSAFPTIDYLAIYPAKIHAQNADLTLEVTCDDARIGGLSKVSIRHGIPGVEVKVAAGSRVLIGFENGDPQQYYAALWDTASCTELHLNGSTVIALNGTSKKVAKGEDLNSAISNALLAIQVAINAMGAVPSSPMPGSLAVAAATAIGAAKTAFDAAAASALSTTVKVS